MTVLPEKTEATEPTDCQEPALDIIKSTLEKLPKDLTSDQKQQVIDLLRDYQDVFSKGTFDMGRTTLVEHSIDTGQYRPTVKLYDDILELI